MKGNRVWAALAALIVAVAALLLVYRAFAPQPTAGEKAVTVTVIHADGSEKTVELHTDEEYLGPAMAASGELGVEREEGPYGLYIKAVDGEAASDADKTFWALSQDGVESPNGADRTPIADGERYELTLTKGSW